MTMTFMSCSFLAEGAVGGSLGRRMRLGRIDTPNKVSFARRIPSKIARYLSARTIPDRDRGRAADAPAAIGHASPRFAEP
jgi:hypothetical protein